MIVPAVSAFSSAGAVRWLGAVPVFVDAREDGNINPDLIERAVTPKTRAIIAVHLNGKIAEMDTILAIANKHSIFLIEDAAQAIGAKYKGKPVGYYGDIACLSFNPMKILSAYGDGGAVVTRSKELAEKVYLMRTYGARPKEIHFNHPLVGIASRLNSFQAAALSIKLKSLERDIDDCRKNFFVYEKMLRAVPGISFLAATGDDFINGHRFMILTAERNELKKFLHEKGVKTNSDHVIPLPYFSALNTGGYKEGDFPVAERIAQEALFLPTRGMASSAEEVSALVKEYFKNRAASRGA